MLWTWARELQVLMRMRRIFAGVRVTGRPDAQTRERTPVGLGSVGVSDRAGFVPSEPAFVTAPAALSLTQPAPG